MKLRPFRQEHAHTCLPACVRIVLDYWGHESSEGELARACGSIPFLGTSPTDAVEGLEELGYRAIWFENATLERLIDLLEEEWPVIVFLRATDLPHGRAGLHAVVVSGLEGGQVMCVDPAIGQELHLTISNFVQAWSALGNQGMVVWPAGALRAGESE